MQYETGLIFGSDNYRKNFLINYFQNKQCKESVINSSPYSFYQYTCDNKNQFEDFPDLNLSLDEKHNFILTKNDLFKKVGNKYFFLVVFQVTQMNVNFWRLGQLFFKKYPIFLSYDDENNSTIIYYTTNKEKIDGGSSSGLTIALAILIPLIVIGLVLFGIYHYRKRNKKADELLSDNPGTNNENNYQIVDNNQ